MNELFISKLSLLREKYVGNSVEVILFKSDKNTLEDVKGKVIYIAPPTSQKNLELAEIFWLETDKGERISRGIGIIKDIIFLD